MSLLPTIDQRAFRYVSGDGAFSRQSFSRGIDHLTGEPTSWPELWASVRVTVLGHHARERESVCRACGAEMSDATLCANPADTGMVRRALAVSLPMV